MTTVFPGALDSYADKVDGVDDVMAAHVNDMQDAIEAIELHLQTKGMMTRVRNTSGGTVAANDVGYIDDSGEFKTIASAYYNAIWCVVISGAANNSDIIVARQGRITVVLNGNCSAGDYLYTSSTAKQAQPLSYVRPEVLGVAITANASGAGGTCEALLLTGRSYLAKSHYADVCRVNSSSGSDFTGTINGAPVGATLVYTVTGGTNENSIKPAGATHLSKIVLHNTTRGDSGLIDSVDLGTNTITLIASVPGTWAHNDVITTRSQTNTQTLLGEYFFDYDLDHADNAIIPALAVNISVSFVIIDGGVATFYAHPFIAYASTAAVALYAQTGSAMIMPIPLHQRKFTLINDASGAGTATWLGRLLGMTLAVP